MKIIKTKYFQSQLDDLSKKYPLINQDFDEFAKDIKSNIYADLGSGNFKCRWKNSSIPCGKSGGLRFIVFIKNEKCIPLLIYSKRIQIDVSKDDIKIALQKTIEEIEK